MLTGLFLLASTLISQAHAEPRVIITNAFLKQRDILGGIVTASWATIESKAGGYPTSLHPYDDGFYTYQAGIRYRFYKNDSPTTYNEYWDALWGGGRVAVRIQPEDTWETLAAKYVKEVGASGTADWFHYKPETPGYTHVIVQTCMIVAKNNWGQIADSSAIAADPLSCSNIPEVENPAVCDIAINGSNTLDHATLNESAVNGHTATATATLSCNKPASVGFRFLSQSVELGNGITSTIKINDSLSPIVSVNKPTNVTIKSTLAASNPLPGPFAGSAIIIAEVQ